MYIDLPDKMLLSQTISHRFSFLYDPTCSGIIFTMTTKELVLFSRRSKLTEYYRLLLVQQWWEHTYCYLRSSPALGKNHEISPGNHCPSLLLQLSWPTSLTPVLISPGWIALPCYILGAQCLTRRTFFGQWFHASSSLLSSVSKHAMC